MGAARTLEAYRVYRLADDARIVSSGRSVAAVMRDTLVGLGVPDSRIVLEDDSRTTHDEAVLIARMLRQLQPRQVVLVTSAVHMRRALATFRAQGIDPVPAIARDPHLSLPLWQKLLPTYHGLEATSDLAHELLGIPYYAVRGWLRL